MQQIGDRLRLEWRAPTRNQDGTREKLDLREARVLRRVLDLDALVKAQTHPSPANTETKPETELAAAGSIAETPPAPPAAEAAPAEPAPAAETGATLPSETPPSDAQAGAASTPVPTEPELAGPPAQPLKPQVVFPPFEAEAVVAATEPATLPGEAEFYEDPVDPTWIGKRVEYAIVYVNLKKRVSPLSAKVPIDPVSALEPPGTPSAEVGDYFVSLKWSPQTDTQVGYLVFRRPGGETAATGNDTRFAPLEEKPLSEPEFDDHTIAFGAPVCYAVATAKLPPPAPTPSVATETTPTPTPTTTTPATTPTTTTTTTTSTIAPATESEAETGGEAPAADVVPVVPPITPPPRVRSRLSDEVCLTPEDNFPPPVVTGLVAVPSAEGILLTWRGVEAADLRGYRVYRAPEASGPYELLAEVDTPTYSDTEAPVGEARFYSVTSIDSAPGTNESKRSEIASATRPQ